MFVRFFGMVGLAAVLAVAPEAKLGQPFELKPAESATIEGLRITFEGVGEDSRCPSGGQCVWAGDAAAAFSIQKPPAAAARRTLHTSGRFERRTDYGDFVVRLEDLKPYPKDGEAIAADDYRAILIVTRR